LQFSVKLRWWDFEFRRVPAWRGYLKKYPLAWKASLAKWNMARLGATGLHKRQERSLYRRGQRKGKIYQAGF